MSARSYVNLAHFDRTFKTLKDRPSDATPSIVGLQSMHNTKTFQGAKTIIVDD